MFPFLALYLTYRFDVGLTQVGIVFLLFMVTGMVGSIIGGMLTDKLGRKRMILFGLVMSAVTSLSLIIANDFEAIYGLALFVGLFSGFGGPAQQAIIADLLPQEQHTEGYGIWRVVANLAITFGALLGGFMADYSFALLFILDALSSVITAVILVIYLKETRPAMAASSDDVLADDVAPAPETQASTGYGPVLRDWPFLAFIVISMLMVLVYMQMNQTLPVYLRDEHGVSPRGFGYILSLNTAMVVLLQYWFTRKIRGRPPFLVMAIGTALYGIGFGMYGFVSQFSFFLLAMVIITIGEMLTAPVGQALVAKFAPEDMRGRYMAISGFSWAIPSATGLILAGLIIDNIGPNWVWYLAAIVSIPAVLGFVMLGRIVGDEPLETIEDEVVQPTLDDQALESAVPA
jgi:MFS family permease